MPKNSNFDFIASFFPEAYAAAKDAEELVNVKPIASAMYSRQAMEFLLNWVYFNDVKYEKPYQDTIAAKIFDATFQQYVGKNICRGIDLIRRIGNSAVHTRRVTKDEARSAVKLLFNWSQYVMMTYTDEKVPIHFNNEFIPLKEKKKEQISQITLLKLQLAEEIEKQRDLQAQILENEEQKAAHEKLKAAYAKIKKENEHITIPPSDVTEAETRRLYIDVGLKSVGWDLSEPGVIEYEVDNISKSINPTGKGYIDYVLWGDDGLPLAVIEAKKTSKSEKDGKNQAEAYADSLEKKFGQRPIIFYTNGFNTMLWDDQFAIPRRVFGFYSKSELQLMVSRRQLRKDLTTLKIDKGIANREYQEGAFKSVQERLQSKEKGKVKEGKRKALLVMATGTGKTRTAIALVKMMMKANWAKKVLFLADRNPLVKQAKTNFNDLVPEFTSSNITKEAYNDTIQLVFSTYQTMINRIDKGDGTNETIYGVGHFDLIIIDEAHRSIYSKYQDIFHYFDGLIIGLTATPREDTDHQTYSFFDCEDGNPTFHYELDTAVHDTWLVPPKKIELSTKIMQRGIKYADLSDEEKIKYEDAFAAYGEDVPEEISASAVNKWLFNKPTVKKVMNALMEQGHRVESGDTLGKTIIFAVNQKHADFIEKIFTESYTEYSGSYTRVITYQDKYSQDSIDKFRDSDRPRIAISVDMLDTGIDVPEVLNLVFFKPVFSKTKFWQMIGRGTRLCENIFSQGKDKKEFLVFDVCGNFEYFGVNPGGQIGSSPKSLSHCLFEVKILIAEALKAYSDEEQQYSEFRELLLNAANEQVKQLFIQRNHKFAVRLRLEAVEKFSQEVIWHELDQDLVKEVVSKVGPIVIVEDTDEKAKLFDLLIYRMELDFLNKNSSFDSAKEKLKIRAVALLKKSNIKLVKEKLPLLKRLQDESYWKDTSIPSIEYVRTQLRTLMKLLEGKEQPIVETDLEDVLAWEPRSDVLLPTTPQNYLERVKTYIRENKEYVVIQKITSNQPITTKELEQLEAILFDGDTRGTKDDFIKATNSDRPLGTFIRSILGLSRRAALEAFSEFTNQGNLSADQHQFVSLIIDHFEEKGFIDPTQLWDTPYNTLHMEGIDGVFGDDSKRVISIITHINDGAVGA